MEFVSQELRYITESQWEENHWTLFRSWHDLWPGSFETEPNIYTSYSLFQPVLFILVVLVVDTFILLPKELKSICFCCLKYFSAWPSFTTLEIAVRVQANLAGKVPRCFVEISGWTIYWSPSLGECSSHSCWEAADNWPISKSMDKNL